MTSCGGGRLQRDGYRLVVVEVASGNVSLGAYSLRRHSDNDGGAKGETTTVT